MAIFGRKRDDGPAAPAADPGPAKVWAILPPHRTPISACRHSAQHPRTRPTCLWLRSRTPPPQRAECRHPSGPAPVGVPARPQAGRIDAGERRTLVVGRGISLQGTVADAERLVVEGTVESEMIQASRALRRPAGIFKGEVQVEDAEIAGLFDGTITARDSLVIRAAAR